MKENEKDMKRTSKNGFSTKVRKKVRFYRESEGRLKGNLLGNCWDEGIT